MAYKNWKLMDRISVAVRSGEESYRGFTGYVVEAGDEAALEKAKDWARTQTWDPVQRKHVATHEPSVHTFDNEGFTVRIVDSAGGSSQGGRLSFWACEVEKNGVKFTIGCNDEILAGLIKSSDMHNGEVKQKCMFARKGGQPGLIHEAMDMYADATADMKHKADMKSMKKTTKWELGGIYQTITQTDICLGEVWDTYEEVTVEEESGWGYGRRYSRTKLVKRDKPVRVLAWDYISKYTNDGEIPKTFREYLEQELKSNYIRYYTGKPPARAKTQQLEVQDSDMKLLDKLLAGREDESAGCGSPKIKGRYMRIK